MQRSLAQNVMAVTLMALVLLWTSGGEGASLLIEAMEQTEDLLTCSVSLEASNGDEPTGMQFELKLRGPGLEVIDLLPGDAAIQASKSVLFNQNCNGVYSVLVVGMNQEPIANGSVLTMQLSNTSQKTHSELLSLSSIVMTDALGEEVLVESEEDTARGLGDKVSMSLMTKESSPIRDAISNILKRGIKEEQNVGFHAKSKAEDNLSGVSSSLPSTVGGKASVSNNVLGGSFLPPRLGNKNDSRSAEGAGVGVDGDGEYDDEKIADHSCDNSETGRQLETKAQFPRSNLRRNASSSDPETTTGYSNGRSQRPFKDDTDSDFGEKREYIARITPNQIRGVFVPRQPDNFPEATGEFNTQRVSFYFKLKLVAKSLLALGLGFIVIARISIVRHRKGCRNQTVN
ncbi:hypothetical protein ACFL1X_08810 [Candidatus Hydrogenedentota bacterium]